MDIKRIQRKRTRGWRSPKDTRFCGRGTKYGNHFKVVKKGTACFVIENTLNNKFGEIEYKTKIDAVNASCRLHSFFLHRKYQTDNELREYLEPLHGYGNLSCWCRTDQRCHVDYLIELIKRLWK